jgi:Fe-S cluster assembly iron-binding protein IscA
MCDVVFFYKQVDSLYLTGLDLLIQRISQVKPGGFLRLRVDGGGCSGFKYKFELSESLDSDDHIFER